MNNGTGSDRMMKIDEYKTRADECRKLATISANNNDYRERLLQMAETWEAMAEGRKRTLLKRASIENLERS